LTVLRSVEQPWSVRIRAPHGPSDALLSAAHALGVAVHPSPLVADGYAELSSWLLEQSVSRTMHRYGRLLTR
jgi:RHH-type proline utilization regulon transcriptional repressor/proline dehydrogenase/delta 1-pyrroline-5-carboxylate dehydrogenase